jgi:predicted nucleotidyltransferase
VLDRLGRPLAVAGVARETALTHNAANSALVRLREAGLVQEIATGASPVFTLNSSHPFVPALQALFEAERRRHRVVHEATRAWAEAAPPSVAAVWLFGSVARREDTFGSDIDLAIVATDRERAQAAATTLREVLAPLAVAYAIQPNVVSFDAHEVLALPTESPALWSDLLRDTIVLYGPPPAELRESLASALTDTTKE